MSFPADSFVFSDYSVASQRAQKTRPEIVANITKQELLVRMVWNVAAHSFHLESEYSTLVTFTILI